jgi:hypothetical protein
MLVVASLSIQTRSHGTGVGIKAVWRSIDNIHRLTLRSVALRCLSFCLCCSETASAFGGPCALGSSRTSLRQASSRVFLNLLLRYYNANHSALIAGHFHSPCASDGTQEMLGHVRSAAKSSIAGHSLRNEACMVWGVIEIQSDTTITTLTRCTLSEPDKEPHRCCKYAHSALQVLAQVLPILPFRIAAGIWDRSGLTVTATATAIASWCRLSLLTSHRIAKQS